MSLTKCLGFIRHALEVVEVLAATEGQQRVQGGACGLRYRFDGG